MIHSNSQANHPIENWAFANAAARNAAGAYVTADIGKIGYQSDTKTYWRLLTIAPTWATVGGSMPAGGLLGQTLTKNSGTDFDAGWKNAGLTTGGGTPGTFTNTTPLMAGHNNARLVPLTTGRFLVLFSATISQSVAGAYIQCQLFYGTGTAPTKGQALTGTAFGSQAPATVPTANGYTQLVCVGVLSSLTLGTNYWFDVSVVVATGTGSLNPTSFVILEC